MHNAAKAFTDHYARRISHKAIITIMAAIAAGFLMPAAPARAAPVAILMEAPTLQAQQGSTGSFDLLVANPTSTSLHLAGESVELGISGTGVEFTDTTANTVTPYVFPDSFDVDNSFTLDATGVAYPKTDFTTSDVSDLPSSFVVIAGMTSYGLVHVSYSVAANATLGGHNLTFEDIGGSTSTSDENGAAVPFGFQNGILTVVPAVPEPAALGLIALGSVLFIRRKPLMNR